MYPQLSLLQNSQSIDNRQTGILSISKSMIHLNFLNFCTFMFLYIKVKASRKIIRLDIRGYLDTAPNP